jgi:DNA-binding transcriptional LysR family regulator
MGFTGSASFTPLVRHAIRRYRQRWPGVILALEEMNTIRLLDKLRRGALDAAFIRPGVEDPEGIRLIRAPDEEMRVALPASHPLAAHPQIPLTALEGEPLVLFPRAAGLSLYDEISAAFLACGIDPVVDQEVPQMSSVVTLVAANLGVSIVTESITQICLSDVAFRPIAGRAPKARLALAVRNGPLPAVVESLISLVEQIIAATG